MESAYSIVSNIVFVIQWLMGVLLQIFYPLLLVCADRLIWSSLSRTLSDKQPELIQEDQRISSEVQDMEIYVYEPHGKLAKMLGIESIRHY